MSKSPYMNDAERQCAEALAEAFNKFASLTMTHPYDMQEFIDGIHKCQGVIAHRILRRDYPGTFPTCKQKPTK